MSEKYETFADYARRVLMVTAEAESRRRYEQCSSVGYDKLPIDDPHEPSYWLRRLAAVLDDVLLDSAAYALPRGSLDVPQHRWSDPPILLALEDEVRALRLLVENTDASERALSLCRSKIEVAVDLLEKVDDYEESALLDAALTILRSLK